VICVHILAGLQLLRIKRALQDMPAERDKWPDIFPHCTYKFLSEEHEKVRAMLPNSDVLAYKEYSRINI